VPIDVHAGGAESGLGERRRQGQANVAQPDDGNVRGVVSDFVL